MKKIALLAASLSLCALFAFEQPIPAAAESAVSYQFARAGDVGHTRVLASDVLSSYLGAPLCDAERDYLASHGDFLLTYSSSIPSSNVHTDIDGETLTVSAEALSYDAINRSTVTWTPVTADGIPMSAEGGQYTLTKQVGAEDGDTVSVEYETSFSVGAEDISAFLNLAYGAAQEAAAKLKQEQARYESALAQYNAAKQKYDDYLAAMEVYRAEREAYSSYLTALAAWQRKNAEYEAYQKKLEQYLKDKAGFDGYGALYAQYEKDMQRYQEYLSEKRQYEQKMKEYEASTSSLEAQTAIYQLDMLAYISRPATSLKRTLSSAILGNSVTQVLANSQALIIAGAEERVINLAKDTTINLRRLLNQLLLLDTDEARYSFYIGAQEQLSLNFNNLFRCLDYLYHGFQIVRGKVREYDRTEQFEIMLAQLYYLCNALDDEPVANYYKYRDQQTGRKSPEAADFGADYKIGGPSSKRTPAAILGADGVLTDRDLAAPLDGGYPNLPDKPTAPDPVEEPTYPQRPAEPVAPTPVSPVGEPPETVNEPTMPEEPPLPGESPKPYSPTEEESALSSALGEEITFREPLTQPFVYRVRTTVVKYFRNAQIVSVYFHRRAEEAEYSVEEAEIGSYVPSPDHIVPARSETGYTCTFDGWALREEPDTVVDLNHFAVPKDVSEVHLIPHYSRTPNAYPVVWTVNGVDYEGTCLFGETPRYDENAYAPLVKAGEGVRQYRFVGWDSKIVPMTVNGAHYMAVFEASCVISWSVNGSVTSQSVWKGDLPVPPENVDRSADLLRSYTFTGWDSAVVPATEDKMYTAQYRERLLAGGGTVTMTDEGYVADCTALSAQTLDIGGLFALSAEKNVGATVRFSNGTVSFSAEAVFNGAEAGVGQFSFAASMTGASSFRYEFRLYGEEGEIFPENCTAELVIGGEFDRTNLYLREISPTRSEAEPSVYFSFDEAGRLVFRMRPGCTYELFPMYHVGIVSSGSVSIEASTELARRGEKVTLTVGEAPVGMYLDRLYVRASDGSDVELGEDLSFVMPRGGVTVGAVCEYHQYTVRFKADGKVVYTRTYRYGEQIESPPAPYKASDDTYSYRFDGWDAELGTVTGDAEFNAVFVAEELPEEVIPESDLNRILRVARVAAPIALSVFAVLVVFLIVLIIVLRRRKKRALAARKAAEKTAEEAPMSETQPAEIVDEAPMSEDGEAPAPAETTSPEEIPSPAVGTSPVAEPSFTEQPAFSEEGLDEAIVRRIRAEMEAAERKYGAYYPIFGAHEEGEAAPAAEAYHSNAVPNVGDAAPSPVSPAPVQAEEDNGTADGGGIAPPIPASSGETPAPCVDETGGEDVLEPAPQAGDAEKRQED